MEIWKDIIGYKSLRQISNLGRVKIIWFIDNKRKPENGSEINRLCKLTKGNQGYFSIGLSNNNKKIDALVHRLVAIAFIPNPENKPFIIPKRYKLWY